MKRLITLLISLTLAIALAGQSSNKSRYVYNFAGGITVGGTYATNDFNEKIDSIRIIGGTAYIYNGADTIPVYTPVADQIDNATVFTKLAPDTVQHTANYTVAASDWGKDQHCLKATSILITIPANLTDWPVGGVMNFYGEGAGIMVFKKSSTVFISDKDSIATSRKGQAVSIKKIATNKYFLVGPLTD